MKRKMLLLGSLGAMCLSVVMLVTPSSAAAIIHRCSFCSNAKQTAVCQPLTADSCVCPLPPPLTSNSCF